MKTALFFACILAAVLAVVANSAQHGSPPTSPAPSVNCSDVAFDMSDCVNYLSDDSNAAKPTDSCCAGFEAVLSLDDECLCFALTHSADFGVAVNLTRAGALSSECGVSAPPLSKCEAITPSSAPEPEPAAPSDGAAYAISAPFMVHISFAVASTLSLFMWL